MNNSREKVSIPGRIADLIWSDEQFYSFIEKDKRVSVPRFPRFDQWCEKEQLCMAFALAGYSKEDVYVSVKSNRLLIKSANDSQKENSIQQGMIVRGIAKRKFEVSYIINDKYDALKCKASMKDGLLKINIPLKQENPEISVNILKEE